MSDEHTVKVKLDPANPTKGKTDWERVNAMTEEEIEKNALADPDNPPMTEEELRQFKRVPDVRTIRKRLNLSQSEFADIYHLSLRTLQDWEQQRSRPDMTAIAFLTAIENDPKAVKGALKKRPDTHL